MPYSRLQPWRIFAVLLLTVAGFSGAMLYGEYEASKLDENAASIASDTADSIEHLAAASRGVFQLQAAAHTELHTLVNHGAPVAERLFDAVVRIEKALSDYLALPLYPSEIGAYDETTAAVQELKKSIATFTSSLEAGQAVSASETLHASLSPATLRVQEALTQLIALNTAEQRRLASEIPQVRLQASASEKRLVAIFAISGLVLMIMVVTGVRRYAKLIDEQRQLAEERAHSLAVLGAGLESINGVIIKIASSIFQNHCLETVLGLIANEARSIMRADNCAIVYNSSPGSPIEVWADPLPKQKSETLGGTTSSSYLQVPISRFERQVGTLFLSRLPGQPAFTETDERLLGFFTSYVGVAIDNARLYVQAQAAVQAREDLLAFVAHDLRNPLSAILGASEMLVPANASDRTAQLGALIQKSASRMLHLTEELLETAKLDSGLGGSLPQMHQLQLLLEEAMELLRGLAAEKSIQLISHAGEVPLFVTCDRSQIIRVLTNLIGNAIKFTPREGTVTVAIEGRGDEVHVSILDSGPGISPAMLPHLFDRYWQARDGKRSGVGLGLYISKAFVEANHGRIWVDPPSGQGAHFHITLPTVLATHPT